MPATRAQPYQRLYVNIDHVATLRQARRGAEPDPVAAAAFCEDAGADGITAHLREDRRHIQDDDINRLIRSVRTVLNLEMAATDEMIEIAAKLKPYQVTLVPERRLEVTTEGGLNVAAARDRIAAAIARLNSAGIRTSLFIDPDPLMVDLSKAVGAHAIELHTGEYSHNNEVGPLETAARQAAALGLAVHAGHGLTVENVGPVAAIPEIEELNIGHSIVSRALFVGLAEAVREIRVAMNTARASI